MIFKYVFRFKRKQRTSIQKRKIPFGFTATQSLRLTALNKRWKTRGTTQRSIGFIQTSRSTHSTISCKPTNKLHCEPSKFDNEGCDIYYDRRHRTCEMWVLVQFWTSHLPYLVAYCAKNFVPAKTEYILHVKVSSIEDFFNDDTEVFHSIRTRVACDVLTDSSSTRTTLPIMALNSQAPNPVSTNCTDTHLDLRE